MSDLRFDPIFGIWCAIAESRRDRPLEFLPAEQSLQQLICPFCRGNEEETPPALLVLDSAGSPLASRSTDWLCRVIPNKYPTFFPSDPQAPLPLHRHPYQHSTAVGTQELIIPSPRHITSLSELNPQEFLVGLQATQIRLQALRDTPTVAHAMLFANCRYEAGASVAHVHLQLIGSPLSSPRLQARAERFRLAWAASANASAAGLLTQLVQQEQDLGLRCVAETTDLVLFCPFASRQAFQVWIAPKTPQPPLSDAPQKLWPQIVELSQQYLSRLETLLNEPAYNWVVHQLPFAEQTHDQWFIEIFPRTAKMAGYEWGTDIWINPVAPELAARRLRNL